MMLMLAVIYDVPELNLGYHLYLKSDEPDAERMRLTQASGDGVASQRYTQQVDEDAGGAPPSGTYSGIPSFPRPQPSAFTEPSGAQ